MPKLKGFLDSGIGAAIRAIVTSAVDPLLPSPVGPGTEGMRT
jgi:hypothetical protein